MQRKITKQRFCCGNGGESLRRLNITSDEKKHTNSVGVCNKCGFEEYEEWEELEYEKGGDDPMCGGALVPMKFTRCGNCD
jgi:hypothetical protein